MPQPLLPGAAPLLGSADPKLGSADYTREGGALEGDLKVEGDPKAGEMLSAAERVEVSCGKICQFLSCQISLESLMRIHLKCNVTCIFDCKEVLHD